MTYKEELLWILDSKEKHLSDEEKIKQNISFVHSLGQKCDSVGWSKLDLSTPNATEILDKIDRFCKTNHWRARGWYTRSYPDIISDWYEIKTATFKDNTIGEYFTLRGENNAEITRMSIRAYHETDSFPKEWDEFYVSEYFRNACLKHNIKNIDFCWIEDKGKYEATQYFALYPSQQIPRIYTDHKLTLRSTARLQALGGYLPRIATIFSELCPIELPDLYRASDMPDNGIAYVYVPSTDNYCGRKKLLIHKDTAKLLIQEKVLSDKILIPVPIVSEIPSGYMQDSAKTLHYPTNEYREQMLFKYEERKTQSRPVRKISEKEALATLRRAKHERKEDFCKRLSQNISGTLMATPYESILPYYLITNGGYLSDEYQFLSHEDSESETLEFQDYITQEELLEQVPDGIVIAHCADGDNVLLLSDNRVIRFSHEEPENIYQWNSLAQFIYDAITEEE